MNSDVLSQLNSTRSLFASYLRIRSLTTGGAAASSSSSTSPELKSARSDLESALVSLADDLDDLVESVEAVETNPAAYGLTAEELTRRKRLIQDVGGEVEDMRDELNKKMDEAAAKAAAAASGKGGRGGSSELPDPSSFALGDDDDADAGGGDNYAQFEQQQQVEMMREQDQHLDGVFRTVGTLRRQADDMGRELEEQTEMLEVLDTDADRVGRRLQTGMQKLGYIVRRNEDRWSSCFIAVLIFVLILLLVLLVII